MSWEGTVIGAPLAGFRMLWAPSISIWASSTASLLERKMDRHLVTVKVSVEGRTCQWVELECSLSFDHLRLERLDTETVKRRGSVEKHGMALHDMPREYPIPQAPCGPLSSLGALDGLDYSALDELAD